MTEYSRQPVNGKTREEAWAENSGVSWARGGVSQSPSRWLLSLSLAYTWKRKDLIKGERVKELKELKREKDLNKVKNKKKTLELITAVGMYLIKLLRPEGR